MLSESIHSSYMRQALKLALKGIGRVSPNPLVGCVLVKNGKVIAEGFHSHFGGPHAETIALQKAKKKAQGAVLYINLEPCSHFGKTPPCAPTLVQAGIAEVYAAMKDPNPLVSGKGISRLRRSGIKVHVGLLEKEARALNRPFETFVLKKRPYILLKAAVSLDGKMLTSGGQSKWITSPEARRHGRLLRSQADAILVGSNTVLKDNPSLTSHGLGRNPLRVVLDTHLKLSPGFKVFQDSSNPTIWAVDQKRLSKKTPLVPSAYFLGLPRQNGHLDLKALLEKLAQMGVGTLLVEGGPEVHTSFLKEKLADEIALFVAPKIFGGEKARTFFEGEGFAKISDALKLEDLRVKKIGPDILIQGTFA